MQRCGMTVTLPVSKRGTVTLPPELRRKLGLDRLANPLVLLEDREDGVLLRPAAAVPVRDLPLETLRQWVAEDEEALRKFKSTLKPKRTK
jgi:bifunctional DNA-binding transcriptional regulator/antitoxin component of YhaV-PrlF toxin-antitoxin module